MTEKTESNALVVAELSIHLPTAKPEYKSMLQNIDEKAPAVAQATSQLPQVALAVHGRHARCDSHHACALGQAYAGRD
jgi:hypothetical protein